MKSEEFYSYTIYLYLSKQDEEERLIENSRKEAEIWFLQTFSPVAKIDGEICMVGEYPFDLYPCPQGNHSISIHSRKLVRMMEIRSLEDFGEFLLTTYNVRQYKSKQ